MKLTARAALLLWPIALVAGLGGGVSTLLLVAVVLDLCVVGLGLLDAASLPAEAVTLERRTPESSWRGRPLEVAYDVTNTSDRALRVRIADGSTGLDVERRIAARSHVVEKIELRPQRRGLLQLAPPVGRVRTSIGLVERPMRVQSLPSVKVLPDVSGVGRFERMRRLRNLRALGIVPVRQRGEGTELESLRPYAQGDSYRSISWKATARRNRPIVRELRAERQQHVVLLLDCGRRMARQVDDLSRLDHAIEAALLLAQVALRSGDRVGLVAFADQILRVVPAAQGAAQGRRLAEAVASLQPVLREPPYSHIVGSILRQFSRRSFFLLFTDAAEPESVKSLLGPVAHLARRHLVATVLFRDELVDKVRASDIGTQHELYFAGAASDLAVERERAKRLLSRGGALVVEATTAGLSSAVVNRYLEAKARHLI